MGLTREVWRIGRAGALDRLRRQTEALADPGPGQARVAVRAVGLNFADLFACLGLYSATPAGPFVPGLEFAGVVEALGPPAAGGMPHCGLRSGDRVIGLTRFGAYATALNLDLRYLTPIPPAWSFAEAAAFPVQALTAWYGLIELGALAPGDGVLVHSAAGGVGLNALSILAGKGTRVVATVGRPAKRDFLVAHCELAPEQVIVRERRGFGRQLDRALAALDLDGFDLPTLIIHGAKSQLYAAATSLYLEARLPDDRRISFERSGHAPHLEEPDRFNRVIAEFAATLAGRDQPMATRRASAPPQQP